MADDLLFLPLRAVGVDAVPCLDRYTSEWRAPQTQRRDPSPLFSKFLRDALSSSQVKLSQNVCPRPSGEFHADSELCSLVQ